MKYNKKDLVSIYKCVVNDQYDLLKLAYPNIYPIRELLQIAIFPFKYSFSDYLGTNDEMEIMLFNYLYDLIELFNKSPYNEFVDNDLINIITYNLMRPDEVIDRLHVLFEPTTMYQDKKKYFECIDDVIYVLAQHTGYQFKDKRIDDLYQILQEFKKNYTNLYSLIDYNMITLIFGYSLINDIDCCKYVKAYLNDNEYYKEKLALYGLKPDYHERITSIVYKKIFDIIPNIINLNPNKIIRR